MANQVFRRYTCDRCGKSVDVDVDTQEISAVEPVEGWKYIQSPRDLTSVLFCDECLTAYIALYDGFMGDGPNAEEEVLVSEDVTDPLEA